MPHFPTPHSRYRHVFVVVRLPKDDTRGRDGPIHEDDVTLTKAFLTQDAAEREADRLNEINGRYWSYSMHLSRLVDGVSESST